MNHLNKLDFRKKTDRYIEIVLVSLFVFGIGLAFVYNTFVLALSSGILCLSIYYASKYFFKGTKLYQYCASLAFGIFMAQFIYQMHGLFEMHFFAFVGCTVLIAYHNWKAQIPLLVFILVHHSLFAYLQYNNVDDIYFTQLEFMTIEVFIYHAGIAGAIIIISGYWAHVFEQKNKEEEQVNKELSSKLLNYTGIAQKISNYEFEAINSIRNEGTSDVLTLVLLNMAEEIKLKQEQVARNNSELKNLVYALSHDLKTPVRGINSTAEWIASDIEKEDYSEMKENLFRLQVNSKSIWDKLESLRMYLNVGLDELEKKSIDIGITLKKVEKELINQRNLVLNFENLGKIETSEEMFYMIFQQLIENSIIHSNREDPKVSITREDVSNRAILYYQDNGPGMTTVEFNKYSKLFQTGTKNYGELRSGIGIPLIIKLVTELKGELTIQDCQEGFRLKIDFPITSSNSI